MSPFSLDLEVRQLMERCADEELPALDRLLNAAALQQYLHGVLQALADVARDEEGHSWADVGTVLSITKQAAHQRFGGERLLDDRGTYVNVDRAPTVYLASLEDAREALFAEGGRERDLRLVEAGIARARGGQPDLERRQELEDARDALRDLGGREADVALIDKALASDELGLTDDPDPVTFIVVDEPKR